MCVCVCVREDLVAEVVCTGVAEAEVSARQDYGVPGLTHADHTLRTRVLSIFFLCVRMCVCAFVCVHVCLCVTLHASNNTHLVGFDVFVFDAVDFL